MLKSLNSSQLSDKDESQVAQDILSELRDDPQFRRPDLNWEAADYLKIFERFELLEVNLGGLSPEIRMALLDVRRSTYAFPSVAVLSGEKPWPAHLHMASNLDGSVFYHFLIQDEAPARFGHGAPRKPVITWSQSIKTDDGYVNEGISHDMNADEFLGTLVYLEAKRALDNLRKSTQIALRDSQV